MRVYDRKAKWYKEQTLDLNKRSLGFVSYALRPVVQAFKSTGTWNLTVSDLICMALAVEYWNHGSMLSFYCWGNYG